MGSPRRTRVRVTHRSVGSGHTRGRPLQLAGDVRGADRRRLRRHAGALRARAHGARETVVSARGEDGQAVVLLHALGLDWRMWEPVMERSQSAAVSLPTTSAATGTRPGRRARSRWTRSRRT
jgi:hypothetical protein